VLHPFSLREITKIDGSRKSARGVHIGDLAGYTDERRAKALKERRQLTVKLIRRGYDMSKEQTSKCPLLKQLIQVGPIYQLADPILF
jgi:hypothetical protein